MDHQKIFAARNRLEEQVAKVINSRLRAWCPLWCQVSKQASRVEFCYGSFKNTHLFCVVGAGENAEQHLLTVRGPCQVQREVYSIYMILSGPGVSRSLASLSAQYNLPRRPGLLFCQDAKGAAKCSRQGRSWSKLRRYFAQKTARICNVEGAERT